MNKKFWLIFLSVLFLITVSLFTIVKDGVITICPNCEKIIIEKTKSHIVFRAGANIYKVQYKKEFCDNCGVVIKIGYIETCEICKKVVCNNLELRNINYEQF